MPSVLIGLVTNPKTVLLWLAVLREAIRLAKMIGPEKARDTLRAECSNCLIETPLSAHAEHDWRHPKL